MNSDRYDVKRIVSPSVASPRVSIVIPTFRREKTLLEAIESALAQGDIVAEVIVADDTPEASARAFVETIKDPRVRFLHLPPCGGMVGRVRNAGAAHARESLLLFLDDDDLLEPNALATLAQALTDRSDTALAFGVVTPFGPDADRVAAEQRYFDSATTRARTIRGPKSFALQMLFRNALLVCSAVMVRREALEKNGGFDETMRAWEDGECFLRMGRRGGVVFVDAPVARRRVGHPSILSELDGEGPIRKAYSYMYAQYRRAFGSLEFWALKILARLMHELVRRPTSRQLPR